VCTHAKLLQLCPTLCNPMNVAHQAPLSKGFSRQEYWTGLPCPPPGDFPDPGIQPVSLVSSALAGGFFTTWEAQFLMYIQVIVIQLFIYIYTHTHTFFQYSVLLWFITECWTQFPVLYSRTLLFIHLLYNSLQLLILTSQSFSHPPWVSCFWKGGREGLWVEVTAEQKHR